ncbi:MAG: Poly(Beta-D-mannuronate) lyase [Verrucomicrobiaceae bacterium]|nr:Poly(Beta-D-mannuronate) lyase [Verrucomicrobiaceae bacterium]
MLCRRLAVILALLPVLLPAREIPIADAGALKTALKTVQPGDVLVLRTGEWPDAKLKMKAEGTQEQPVTLRAAVPGGTIFTGDSRLQISGHHVIVEGLWFRDPSQAGGEVIELRTSTKELAYGCVVRGCAVTSATASPKNGKTSRFCSVYGTGNTVENCHFEGKTTGGTTLVVWLTPGGEGGHFIRDNDFGPRPRLGENGGETIRLGDSSTAHLNGHCEVTGNLFHHCNGEVEIISVKSNENHIAGNTFLECEGAVTLRHSHRSVVENNLFLGNHRKYTGGVRIIGEDHKVVNNWFEGCEGDGSRSTISFMNAIPNSPASGYYQVKRALVAGNTLKDCAVSISIGVQHDNTCTLPPLDCVIRDNVISSPLHQLVWLLTEAPGWKWENNVMTGRTVGIENLPGVITTMPNPARQPPPEVMRDKVGVPWLR